MTTTEQKTITYTAERAHKDTYYIVCHEPGCPDERVARVGTFMPGPMVSVSGKSLYPPEMARAVAEAMILVAAEIRAGGVSA